MWPWTPLRTSLVFFILHCSRHVRKKSHKRLLSGGGGKEIKGIAKCVSHQRSVTVRNQGFPPFQQSQTTWHFTFVITMLICTDRWKRKLTVMWLSAKINGPHQQQKKNQIVSLWRLQCTGKTYWLPLEQVYLTLETMWQRQLLQACLPTEDISMTKRRSGTLCVDCNYMVWPEDLSTYNNLFILNLSFQLWLFYFPSAKLVS